MKHLLLILAMLAGPVFANPDDFPTKGMESAIVGAVGQPEYKEQLLGGVERYKEIRLASADIDTLNATPVLALTTPATGYVLVPTAVFGFNDYNTGTFEGGSDGIELQYGGATSGTVIMETDNDFLEATADAYTYQVGVAETNASGVQYAPEANTSVYLHIGTDVSAGDGDIALRIYYKLLPADLASDN